MSVTRLVWQGHPLQVGEHLLRARFAPEQRLPAPGETAWLQVLGAHTCYYQNEELLP